MFKLNQIPATIVALANLSNKTDSAKKVLIKVLDLLNIETSSPEKLTFDTINEILIISNKQSIQEVTDYLNSFDLTELINDVTMLVVSYLQNQINEEVVNVKQFVSFDTFKDVESNRYEQDEMPNDILCLQEYLEYFTK